MKLIRKIIVRLIPELSPILTKSLGFNWIENTLENVKSAESTKFYSPYSIHHTTVGKGTYISHNSKISYTTIGKFCSIGPNLVCGWGIHPITGISTSPYFYSLSKQNGSTIADKNLIEERKEIRIGNDVFIGANVTILDGVTIGNGAIIGAGAVVSKDIPNYAIAIGCPIQIKKYRFSPKQITELMLIKWWDFSDEKLKEIHNNFFDIEKFILQNKNK